MTSYGFISTSPLSIAPPDARQPAHFAPGAHLRPAVEYVVVVRFNVIQNGTVKFTGRRNSEASIAIQQGNTRPGLSVEATIALDLKVHKGTPAVIHLPPVQVCLCQSV